MPYINWTTAIVAETKDCEEGVLSTFEATMEDADIEYDVYGEILAPQPGDVFPHAYMQFDLRLPSYDITQSEESSIVALGDGEVPLPGVDPGEELDEDRLVDIFDEAVKKGWPGPSQEIKDLVSYDRALMVIAKLPDVNVRCFSLQDAKKISWDDLISYMEESRGSAGHDLIELDGLIDHALRHGWRVEADVLPSWQYLAEQLRQEVASNTFVTTSRLEARMHKADLANIRVLEKMTSDLIEVVYVNDYTHPEAPVLEETAKELREVLERADASALPGNSSRYAQAIRLAANSLVTKAKEHAKGDIDLMTDDFHKRRATGYEVVADTEKYLDSLAKGHRTSGEER